jgi:diguanylate cyclase (GGDEF)-like protein
MRFVKEYLIDRWGLVVFVFLVAFLFVFNGYVAGRQDRLLAILFAKKVSLFLAVAYGGLVLVSWVSYPKVYKTRIFLLGPVFLPIGIYSVLYLGSACKVLPCLAGQPELLFFKKSVLLLTALNFLVLSFIPTYMEYRKVRKWAIIILVAEWALLTLWFRFFPQLGPVVQKAMTTRFRTLMVLVCAGIAALSVLRLSADDKQGGAWAGMAVFLVFLTFKIGGTHPLAFLPVLPVVLVLIVLNNWFSSLHHRAQYDPLLRIYNRDFYQSIAEGKTNINLGSRYCVAVCDLDRFKRINDRAGHQAGDMVLQGTAQTIRQQALPKGITCRYGGEEIVIFFRKTDIKDAAAVCEHIRKAVGALTFKSGRRKIKVTVSIGVASNKRYGAQVEKVVTAADKAVYQAKKAGRNRVIKK